MKKKSQEKLSIIEIVGGGKKKKQKKNKKNKKNKKKKKKKMMMKMGKMGNGSGVFRTLNFNWNWFGGAAIYRQRRRRLQSTCVWCNPWRRYTLTHLYTYTPTHSVSTFENFLSFFFWNTRPCFRSFQSGRMLQVSVTFLTIPTDSIKSWTVYFAIKII